MIYGYATNKKERDRTRPRHTQRENCIANVSPLRTENVITGIKESTTPLSSAKRLGNSQNSHEAIQNTI